ncbi:DeoR/GlpR family DNA-binding transcription regulator [Hymenobacter mucosus]|uniref:Transcriptional regulator, DeoR family n=1 Tax=Hymenobacter mucosus TaxID=1411120 RepID=A0A238YIF7_9BACT|nr:DeoR/GlpR family DNA-binding transcription regulator [Hymenobacter mucosus]SNR70501.1 transcriptional regulator, DeoR family [Hymenobacter mucosus]
MNPSVKRHQLILQQLQEHKHVEVPDLCEALNVSAVTIRKDLKLLEEKGLLFRTHGGAALENPYIKDRPVNEKEQLFAEEKAAIGAAAARLVGAQEAIIMASGTSMLALARALPPNQPLTVITSALNVGMELLRHPQIEVMQLGGYLRHSSSSVTGPYAEQVLADISCSKLFLGVDGIDLDFGLTTTNIGEAHLNQAMLRAAQETIVLADSSKFGKRGFGRICGLDQVHRIITDAGISAQDVRKLEEQGIALTVV